MERPKVETFIVVSAALLAGCNTPGMNSGAGVLVGGVGGQGGYL